MGTELEHILQKNKISKINQINLNIELTIGQSSLNNMAKINLFMSRYSIQIYGYHLIVDAAGVPWGWQVIDGSIVVASYLCMVR